MKIHKMVENILNFEDESGKIVAEVSASHASDCCEHNYADFVGSLKNAFDENAEFTTVAIFKQQSGPEYGFDLFLDGVRYPINCYSDQNGYYSSDLDVVLTINGKVKKELNFLCPIG